MPPARHATCQAAYHTTCHTIRDTTCGATDADETNGETAHCEIAPELIKRYNYYMSTHLYIAYSNN
jgi:hypothetical protein